MRRTLVFTLLASACLLPASTPALNRGLDPIRALPVRFEPSRAPGIFEARGLPYRMAVTAEGALVDLAAKGSVRFTIRGANRRAAAVPSSMQPGRTNYLLPNDKRSDVPGYNRVTWQEVLPGIDVAYYGANGMVEFDFIVRPGADPAGIAVRYEGQKHLTIDAEGNLLIDTGAAQITQKAPAVYQRRGDNSLRLVAAGYELRGDGVVGYKVGGYDRDLPLIIDPILFSSYVGGSSTESASRVFRDSRGRYYVAGSSSSSDFITTGESYQPTPGGSSDAYLVVIDPSRGNFPVYSTFFGGSDIDRVTGLGVDAQGRAYITGATRSGNFPVSQYPSQGILQGTSDAFFTVLDPNVNGVSSLIYSTYMGGTSTDEGTDLAVRLDGTAVVVGFTDSTDFPMKGSSQNAGNAGARDAFVAVYDVFQTFVYSTYLGGKSTDYARGVAVAEDGSILVVGATFSTDFAVTENARHTETLGGGDAFVTKYTAEGGMVYSSYLGDGGLEEATGVVAGTGNRVWVTGYTLSLNYPITGAPVSLRRGASDAFVTGLDLGAPAANQLFYSTLIGGSETEVPYRITSDGAGGLLVVGYTNSIDFPTAGGAIQPTYGGGSTDGFFFRLNPAEQGTSALVYSTMLGGGGTDIAYDATVFQGNRYVVTGSTGSLQVPANNPNTSPNTAGIGDGFLVVVTP